MCGLSSRLPLGDFNLCPFGSDKGVLNPTHEGSNEPSFFGQRFRLITCNEIENGKAATNRIDCPVKQVTDFIKLVPLP